jgi:DNA-binding NtrC family response regulator
MADTVLIIEDDAALAQMLGFDFEDRGFTVTLAPTCADGLAAAAGQGFDLALLDQQLPDGLGIDLLPRLLEALPGLGVIMMTGQHDLELAIRAIRCGAADFVHKPIKTATLRTAVDRVLASKRTQDADRLPRAPVGDLIGRSDAMLAVSKQIALSAASAATVLIQGESGTGKEVVARLIHAHSGRPGPFVAVNCAAIVATLLESELFGHEKGAFTGADRAKPGRFELATDGTLFLDEIAELAAPLQAKLLRALQERTVERVGSTRSIAVNARIIAATHQDLLTLAGQGDFREDLAYRLNVIHVALPPLRERLDDIPLLAGALLEKAARDNGRAVPRLTRGALDRLQGHPWPGNVRELENVLTQAMVLARDGVVTEEHLQLRQALPQSGTSGDGAEAATGQREASGQPLRSLAEVEADHIQRVLDSTGGHKGRSCEILGISRPALDRKIEKYGLVLPGR